MLAGYLLIAAVCVAFSEAVDLSTITFPKRNHNFAQETHQVHFGVTGTGCVVDGQIHAFGSEFAVSQTGPCIQFDCSQSGVTVAMSQSGCENEDHCQRNEFTVSNCTTHLCYLSDVVSGNIITVTRHLKEVSEARCYYEGICHPVYTYFTSKENEKCVCHDIDHYHCFKQ